MNSIVPFNFEDREVRTKTGENGEPWFVAKDVCEILGIGNPSDTVKKVLSPDEFTLDTIEGSHRPTNLVNESGLYALIFKSRKKKAEQFRKWVTNDVLPSIRKTGQYNSHAITSIHVPQTRLEVIELMLEHEKEREQDKGQIQHLEDQHTIDAPKVAFCNQVIAAPDALSASKAAKVIDMGRNRFLAALRRLGWINRFNEPYQHKIEAGYLDVKLGDWQHPEHGVRQSVTTLITGKGLVKLSKLLGKTLSDDFVQGNFHEQLH